jgi:anthranilate synthase component 2
LILVIDNYDSFTYNLCQYAGETCADIKVARNDEISIGEIRAMKPEGIILSPGPGTPENSGICVDLIRELGGIIPILGICLGHQAIGHAYRGRVVRAREARHGKTSLIRLEDDVLFRGVGAETRVMRYHSLVVEEETLPDELVVKARSLDDGAIMALKHREHDVYGVQFHPESIFTECGKEMINNFLKEVCHVAGSN